MTEKTEEPAGFAEKPADCLKTQKSRSGWMRRAGTRGYRLALKHWEKSRKTM